MTYNIAEDEAKRLVQKFGWMAVTVAGEILEAVKDTHAADHQVVFHLEVKEHCRKILYENSKPAKNWRKWFGLSMIITFFVIALLTIYLIANHE